MLRAGTHFQTYWCQHKWKLRKATADFSNKVPGGAEAGSEVIQSELFRGVNLTSYYPTCIREMQVRWFGQVNSGRWTIPIEGNGSKMWETKTKKLK